MFRIIVKFGKTSIFSFINELQDFKAFLGHS